MTSHRSKVDPFVTSGSLIDRHNDSIVLGLPGTDYQLHLQVTAPLEDTAHQRVTGTIHARARRVDIVLTGGRFIEPLYGRPRGIQGRIIAVDPIANTIVVDCGCPMVCELVAGQKAGSFSKGMLVRFDVERGASFIPA